MRKNLSKLIIFLTLVMAVLVFAACGKKEEVSTDDTEANQEVEENVESNKENNEELVNNEENEEVEKVIELNNLNVLTGLNDMDDDMVGKRPVSVMINNIKAALPQYGVADADVIFDIVVEGDQTRLMALYSDYTKVPYLCSVRSCRYYYAALAKGFDSFYIHWGQDGAILNYLNSLNLDKFDGMSNQGGIFGRNQSRLNSGYALEHTGDVTGSKIPAAIEKKGMRTDLLEEKKGTAFNFCEYDTLVTPTDGSCEEVYIDFGLQNATLKYNPETNTYFKEFNGAAHMDAGADKQLEFTNVFVLETQISVRDSNGYKTLNWKGSDSAVGYYISNGAIQKINWQKADEESYLKFYDLNGEELEINRGKSYIAINYANQATFK